MELNNGALVLVFAVSSVILLSLSMEAAAAHDELQLRFQLISGEHTARTGLNIIDKRLEEGPIGAELECLVQCRNIYVETKQIFHNALDNHELQRIKWYQGVRVLMGDAIRIIDGCRKCYNRKSEAKDLEFMRFDLIKSNVENVEDFAWKSMTNLNKLI